MPTQEPCISLFNLVAAQPSGCSDPEGVAKLRASPDSRPIVLELTGSCATMHCPPRLP